MNIHSGEVPNANLMGAICNEHLRVHGILPPLNTLEGDFKGTHNLYDAVRPSDIKPGAVLAFIFQIATMGEEGAWYIFAHPKFKAEQDPTNVKDSLINEATQFMDSVLVRDTDRVSFMAMVPLTEAEERLVSRAMSTTTTTTVPVGA